MKKYYVKVNSSKYLGKYNGQFQIVSHLKDALFYREKDKEKLAHIISSLPKALRRSNQRFVIAYYDDGEAEEKSASPIKVAIQNNAKVSAVNKVSSKDLMDAVSEISNCFDMKDDLNDKLVELQEKQNDLIHYIELYKFSASEGYQLCKKLQNIRRERREIKNKIEISKMCDDKDTLTLSNVMAKLDRINSRTYQPRYFNTLFENNEGRQK